MRKRIGIVILTLTLSLLLLNSFAHGQLSNGLRVSFIDVGQGDSAWLRASDDTDILIDGGPRSAGPTVVAHLVEGGIDDIDVIVLSHGDADHVGGLIDVLKSAIHVEAVIYNGQHHTTDTYAEFLDEMQKRGLTPTPAEIGQAHSWGAVSASVLNPQEVPTGDQNDDSVVMLVTYGDVDFLFTGDIDSSVEQTIVDTGSPVAAEVLKVAHHGSKYSSSTTFLEAVGPEVAVISVGDNPYGHPAEETLKRLRAVGAQIFRTDLAGTIVVNTDGETYEVEADFLVFLPLVVKQEPPTPTATPTSTPAPAPLPGVNRVCKEFDEVQICASVSNATPAQYTTVTIYGRFLVEGAGQSGHTMNTTWHYRTTTSYCSGTTDADGIAQCSRYISGATKGYQVDVDVEIEGYSVTTWFTPQ